MNDTESVVCGAAPPQKDCTHAARTKVVFLYSDDDEDGSGTSRVKQVEQVGMGIAIDPAGLAALHADALAAEEEEQARRERQEEAERSAVPFPVFEEDLVGASASVAGNGIPVALGGASEGGPGRARAVMVAAPSLRDGALGPDAVQLREHLELQDFTSSQRHLRRKRFRENDEGEVSTSAEHAAGDQFPDEEQEEEEAVKAVLAEDGTVRAVRTLGGYELTVDERDLLDLEADSTAAAVAADDGMGDQDGDVEDLAAMLDGVDDGMDWEDEEEEEEDEEDEELDDALVVAAAEQLVRCCEAADLDPSMTVEAGRFIASVKPLLEQVTSDAISAREFGALVSRDMNRFQRIFRNVYRPRDEPIVIDGVTMDL